MTDLVLIDDLPQLAEQAASLAEESLSPATRSAYRADWGRYVAFCEQRSIDPWGPAGQVALYLAHRVEQGATVAVLSRALAAISKAHQTRNLPNPRRDPAVALVYSGARRRLGVSVEQVEAILPSHLRTMVERMPRTGPHRLRSLRNRALLSLGWAMAARRVELVGLDVEDLTWVPEGLRVRIRRSKTDQEARGRVVGVPYASTLDVCAVRAVREWLDAAGITEGPVFRGTSPRGDEVTDHRLTTRQVANVVGRAADRAGLEGRHAGHSLRAGFVTAAVRAGKPIKAVMAQTGHRTVEMIMRYVREQAIFSDNAAAGLL